MASIQDDKFLDANNTSPRATPTITNGGVFSLFSSFTTKVSPAKVQDALLDYRYWPKWNTFIPECTITYPPDPPTKLEAGCKLVFKVQMSPTNQTSSKEVMLQVDAPPQKPGEVARFRWVGTVAPDLLLKAERVNEIEMTEDGGTIYRTWEAFAGPLAYVVRWKVGDALRGKFQDWSEDLRKYVEAEERIASGSVPGD